MSDKIRGYVAEHRPQLAAIHEDPQAWSNLLDRVAANFRNNKANKQADIRAAAKRRVEARADEDLYSKWIGSERRGQ